VIEYNEEETNLMCIFEHSSDPKLIVKLESLAKISTGDLSEKGL
jgi:hypothetical protein